jgi:hypothetical protein
MPSGDDTSQDTKEVRVLFNKIYKQWARSEPVNQTDLDRLSSAHVDEELFTKLTGSRPLAKYMALIDYRIRFDELPKAPHYGHY